MFKKFLPLLLCLIMMLSLVACKVSVIKPQVETPPVTEDNIDNENTEHEDLSNPNAPNYRDDTITEDMGGITTCMIGETVELENCNITLVGYEVNNGNDWYIPENGCYLGVNLIIENTSDGFINPDSRELYFTGYVDNFYSKTVYPNVIGNGIHADIAFGKKIDGWLIFDVNPDWNKLELDFVYYDKENNENLIEARFLIENEG